MTNVYDVVSDCFAFSISQLDKRSSYNDDAGQKIISNYSATSNDDVMMTTLTTPSWKVNLLDGTWYGATNYMKRELYLRDPNKRKLSKALQQINS